MEKLPIVSVVMISYNHEQFIEEAIKGVLMQECNFEIELILANDCSPDKTDEVINTILKTDPRATSIKYFNQAKNLGMMHNFIFALKQAKGKYIALCEGDDYWTDPLKLQKQVDFLDGSTDFSMCFHDAWVYQNGFKKYSYVNQEKSVFTTEDLFKRHFIPSASIVFRNILDLPPWFCKIASGDKLLLFLLSFEGKIKYLRDYMAVYRMHSGGVSNTHFGVKKVYETALLLHSVNEITNYKYTNLCQEALAYEIDIHIYNKKNLLENNTYIELIIEILKRVMRKIKKII